MNLTDDEKRGLVDKYILGGKSPCEIGREYGVNRNTIKYWLKKRGVQLRNNSEANKVFCKRFPEKRSGQHNSSWRGGTTMGYARKHWEEISGLIAPDSYDIHHIDGNRINNNENNLALMSHSGHRRHHTLLQRIAKKSAVDERCNCENYQWLDKQLKSVAVFMWSHNQEPRENRGPFKFCPYCGKGVEINPANNADKVSGREGKE